MNLNKPAILLLKEKAIRNTTLLIAREFLIKVLTIVGQIILVRILLPQSFGMFAIIIFLIGVFELFTDAGLSPAIIRAEKNPNNNVLSSVFWAKQAVTTISFLVLIVISPYLSSFYKHLTPENILMIRICAIILLFKPLHSILTALLERELQYSSIPIIDLSGTFVYFFVAIVLSLSGFSTWSLVLAVVSKEILETILTFSYKPWIPTFYFNFKEIKSMVNFGLYYQAGSIFSFVRNSIIPVVGGLETSIYSVGLLSWAFNISSIPSSISDNYGRVAFSTFSKIKNNRELLSKSVEKSISILTLILTPFVLLTLLFGKEFILIFATSKWLPALPAVYWFMGCIVFSTSAAAYNQAIIVIGKTKEILIMSIFAIIFECIVAVILTLKLGFIGIAISAFAGSLAFFFGFSKLAQDNKIRINLRNIFFSRIFIFLITLFIIISIKQFLQINTPIILFLEICSCIIVYILSVYVISRRDLFYAFSILRSLILSKSR